MSAAVMCPACGGFGGEPFYHVEDVPVHSCLLLESERAALDFPRGSIALSLCSSCGLIWNTQFDESLVTYTGQYEESQTHSPYFRAFAADLARRWVANHDLVDRRVVEVGCGKGGFMAELLRQGIASGVGIDPAIEEDRMEPMPTKEVEWFAERFAIRHFSIGADAIVSRHTLEHVADPMDFMELLSAYASRLSPAPLLLQIPNGETVFRNRAFWDVYYEHCNYFPPAALESLVQRHSLELTHLGTEYDEQYIVAEARFSKSNSSRSDRTAIDPGLKNLTDDFAAAVAASLAQWRAQMAASAARGETTVIWGAGSKGVAWLNALGAECGIRHAVDINPRKQGKFMAGSGQSIVSPGDLVAIQPDAVIVMNPVYRDEISAMLGQLEINPRLVTV